jgi:hypothetical protein
MLIKIVERIAKIREEFLYQVGDIEFLSV